MALSGARTGAGQGAAGATGATVRVLMQMRTSRRSARLCVHRVPATLAPV
ncbi:Uncharacterised protein [Streptomyces griseus]|nr:hypothetical protein SAMN04490359_4532 [Streptomyces griseus]SQA21663.1 Uncharacterised protein [Streptomyces griseus]